MKILMISTDRKIFETNSDVRSRILEYGKITGDLHIIIFTSKGFSVEKISENVTIYPTNSINRWTYVFDAIRIGKRIRDVELVTAQDPFETGLVGWRVARAVGARLQLQIHTDFLSPYFAKGGILNKVRVIIARFLIPKADCVRVVSERIKISIKDAGVILKSEPIVLPIFVDIEKIQNTYKGVDLHTKYHQYNDIILMVSRLEKEKNISLALSVLKQVVKKYPNTGLIVLGDGREYKNLRSIIKDYKLDSNVIFERNYVEVATFYKTADIFLHTSSYEGYGMVFIESALLGCPVVTTDVGIASELFKDAESAYLCDVLSEDYLVKGIIKLLEDKNLRHDFIVTAEASVSNFIKERTKDEYLKKYKDMWEKCLK